MRKVNAASFEGERRKEGEEIKEIGRKEKGEKEKNVFVKKGRDRGSGRGRRGTLTPRPGGVST